MTFTDDYLQFCWNLRNIWIHKVPKIGDWFMRLDPPELALIHDPGTQSDRMNDTDSAYVPDLDDLLELLDNRIAAFGIDPASKDLQIHFDPRQGWSAQIILHDDEDGEMEAHVARQSDPALLLFRLLLEVTAGLLNKPSHTSPGGGTA